MLVLFDANILLFSIDPNSPHHQECVQATNTIRRNGDTPCIIPQSLYEFWTVATRPITERGLGKTPAQAQAEIIAIRGLYLFFPDTPAIYSEWERLVAHHGVSGKNGHDARYVAAMNVHGITQLLTVNKKDFKRFTTITALLPSDV
jgi:predicted nucleic acid-binding protein